MYDDVGWINLAQERVQWEERCYERWGFNKGVCVGGGSSLNFSTTVSASGRTVLHAVKFLTDFRRFISTCVVIIKLSHKLGLI